MAKDLTRPVAPLIYERATVCELGDDLSIATVIRAENNGLLTPLKPSGKPNGKTSEALPSATSFARSGRPRRSKKPRL
jgi:hypothetical protein